MSNTIFHRLAATITAAIATGNPADVVAIIATTNHSGRLDALFKVAAQRFLHAHREAKQRRSRILDIRARRAKALLDLIRIRKLAIGARRPTVDGVLDLVERSDYLKPVELRRAA